MNLDPAPGKGMNRDAIRSEEAEKLFKQINRDDMRIVVLNDLNLRIAHAVLAVYVSGKPYILDNQISKVVPASSIHHYQPVYSINENGWWLHRGG
jgi:predicted transglutaminase-like cysteine proteinase